MYFLTIALILFFLFFINAFSVLFAKDSNLLTFFAWKKVILIISCNFCRYFKFWTYNLLITIIGAVISILFTYLFNMIFGNIYIAWLVTSIEAAFIATYIAFINMYLVAKSVDSDSVV